jgi:hypothetical protein
MPAYLLVRLRFFKARFKVRAAISHLCVGEETLTVPRRSSVLVRPDPLHQVFNDTDAEAFWHIIGAPEELEFLKGSKSKVDFSPFYPVDPTQSRRNWPAWTGPRRRKLRLHEASKIARCARSETARRGNKVRTRPQESSPPSRLVPPNR